MSSARDRLERKQFQLLEELKNLSKDEAAIKIRQYIEVVTQVDVIVCPEISQGLKWFNCDAPAKIARNDGRTTIIDFFTYCCINCLHILPTLKQVEQDLSTTTEVVGYHSPKFENEKSDINVLNAVKRYDITHPVVCGDGKLWDELGIYCWPTVVVTSPGGQVIFYLVGENVINEFLILVAQETAKFFNSENNSRVPAVCTEITENLDVGSGLSFPGKVKASPDESLIAVSDTGNNRIIISNNHGLVKHVIGGRKRGYMDGNFTGTLFDSPQGVTWSDCGQKLYVADTGNDVIRCINLVHKTVESISLQFEMSSPWDLVLVDSDKIFVAMAGYHQIWLLTLDDVQIGSRKWERYHFKPFAGNGKEENRNNLYPMKAAFAQPSGLAYCGSGKLLFVADSESSSIRSISLKDGAVKNIVGGSIDPLDLFAFGDQDGNGDDVRLQHPMAVSCMFVDNTLIVTDTYNHKLKELNYVKRSCVTLNKVCEFTKLCEPSGVDFMPLSKILLVCDTNNHRVVKINMTDDSVCELDIKNLPSKINNASNDEQEIILGKFDVQSGKDLLLTFDFVLSKTFSLTKDATHILKLTISPMVWLELDDSKKVIQFSDIKNIEPITLVPRNLDHEGLTRIFIESTFFICNKTNGTCLKRNMRFVIPLKISNSLNTLWDKNQVIRVTHEIS